MSKAAAQARGGDPSLGATAIASQFLAQYAKTSPQLKVLDLFCLCALATAGIQFVYAFLIGSFPFNAFLAGFFCCIGSFVLTLSLRMQLSEGGDGKAPARAFVDYVLAMTVLFLAVWCYIG